MDFVSSCYDNKQPSYKQLCAPRSICASCLCGKEGSEASTQTYPGKVTSLRYFLSTRKDEGGVRHFFCLSSTRSASYFSYTALARAAVEGDENALDMFGTWNKSKNALITQVYGYNPSDLIKSGQKRSETQSNATKLSFSPIKCTQASV